MTDDVTHRRRLHKDEAGATCDPMLGTHIGATSQPRPKIVQPKTRTTNLDGIGGFLVSDFALAEPVAE